MMYVELFKQKYRGSEIKLTQFSMAVTRVRYGPGGELLRDDESHAVLVEIDEYKNVFVFAMRSFRDKTLVFGRDWISAFSIACCAAAGLRFEGATRPAHFCSDRNMNAWRKNTI